MQEWRRNLPDRRDLLFAASEHSWEPSVMHLLIRIHDTTRIRSNKIHSKSYRLGLTHNELERLRQVSGGVEAKSAYGSLSRVTKCELRRREQ